MTQSLPEQLTVCALLSLVLTMGLQVATPCLRVWSVDQARSARDQAFLVASLRLERDLRATSRTGLSATASSLALPEPGENYDPRSGQPLFETYALYYEKNGCLVRKSWPRNPGPLKPLTAAEIAAAQADSSRPEQILAREVSRFQVTVGQTVDVELGLTDHAAARVSVEPRL